MPTIDTPDYTYTEQATPTGRTAAFVFKPGSRTYRSERHAEALNTAVQALEDGSLNLRQTQAVVARALRIMLGRLEA